MQLTAGMALELEEFRKQRLLRTVRPDFFPGRLVDQGGPLPQWRGLQVISCCDGHQFASITGATIEHMAAVEKRFELHDCGNDCFHWKTVNGGPFVLAHPPSQLRCWGDTEDHVDAHVLADVAEGMRLKNLGVVLLIAHARCGKVQSAYHSLANYVRGLYEAKQRVMRELGLETDAVIGQLQVHLPDGSRPIYHLDSKVAATMVAIQEYA